MIQNLMRSVEVLGAGGGEVTGSAFALTSNKGTKILVDCGMYQGKIEDKRNESLNEHDPNQFSAVFITHAHLDHVGRLPHLHKIKSPIYMTRATRDLAYIVLRNAQVLTPNLYAPGSVEKVMEKIIPVPYENSVQVDGLRITLKDAGHILGSSSVEVKEKRGEVVVFSGDLGNTSSRTMRPATPIKEANIVVMETTYGDKNHPKENPSKKIESAIKLIADSGGTLLIPSFAIDRTQAILSILKELSLAKKIRKKGKRIPVFLDSPMAILATQTYLNYRELLKDELKCQDNPFQFEELVKTYDTKQSREISKYRGPKIIIAGSGMMTGGRIKKHAYEYLSDNKSAILFVGYPAEGTPSRAIVDGEKEVEIDSDTVSVECAVFQTSALSAHLDQKGLLNWVSEVNYGKRRLRENCLVHGTTSSRNELAKHINVNFDIDNISLPEDNEVVDL